MEKSSDFVLKDEIYKMMKYQTKLALSNNANSSSMYRIKLSEHVENLKTLEGGNKALKTMKGGAAEDDDFFAKINMDLQAVNDVNKHTSDSNSQQYVTSVTQFNDAADLTSSMINDQHTNISKLLQEAERLTKEIDESAKKLIDCTDNNAKYKGKIVELVDKFKEQQGQPDLTGITGATQKLIEAAQKGIQSKVIILDNKKPALNVGTKIEQLNYNKMNLDDYKKLSDLMDALNDNDDMNLFNEFIDHNKQ